MKTTLNDLSYSEMKLDLLAMHTTALIAYHSTLNELHNYVESELREGFYQKHTVSSVTLRRIKQLADNLQVCGETYATLKDGLNRENISIIDNRSALNSR